jgi:hypothetical protein
VVLIVWVGGGCVSDRYGGEIFWGLCVLCGR